METLASEQMMKPDGDVELAPEEVENFRCADDQSVTMDMMGQKPWPIFDLPGQDRGGYFR